MLTSSRDTRKRMMDLVDFQWMVTHSMDEGQTPIDLNKLEALGELVWPGGGGKEILELVDQAKKDELPNLADLTKRSTS